jgi:hypothetical protein
MSIYIGVALKPRQQRRQKTGPQSGEAKNRRFAGESIDCSLWVDRTGLDKHSLPDKHPRRYAQRRSDRCFMYLLMFAGHDLRYRWAGTQHALDSARSVDEMATTDPEKRKKRL